MGEYAPSLAHAEPVAIGAEFKDTSPHFENIDALTALIGTIVSQLFQAGVPFTDTTGNFRPIVIASSGITVNTSSAFPTTIALHDTLGGGTDALLSLQGGLSPVFAPNASNTAVAFGVVNDKAVASVTRAIYLIATASSGNPRIQTTDSTGSHVIHEQTHIVRVKAGAPVDGDFGSPADGMLVVDSTNNRIYARHGGAWHYAALT